MYNVVIPFIVQYKASITTVILSALKISEYSLLTMLDCKWRRILQMHNATAIGSKQ